MKLFYKLCWETRVCCFAFFCLSSAEEMCFGTVFVYPAPKLFLCSSGFSEDAVSDWLNEAYAAGYWNVNTSKGESVADLIEGGSIHSPGDLHPAFWSHIGGKWDSEKDGANEMYDKLLHEEAYSARMSVCAESADVRGETETTFQDIIGDFIEYCTDPCGCEAGSAVDGDVSSIHILVFVGVTLIIIVIVLAMLSGITRGLVTRHCICCIDILAKIISVFLSARTQPATRRFFQWLGLRIHSKPMWFIGFGSALVTLCSAFGFVYYRLFCGDGTCVENRGLYLWIPRRSTVWAQNTDIIDSFGSYPSELDLLLTVVNEEESILNPSNMDIAFEVAKSIHNVTLHDFNDRDYEYTDLCTRSAPSQSHCDSSKESFFAVFFQNNEPLWSEMNSTLSIINEPNYYSMELFLYVDQMNGSWDEIQTLIDVLNSPDYPTALYLGGLEYAAGDSKEIVGAETLRIVYSLKGSSNSTV